MAGRRQQQTEEHTFDVLSVNAGDVLWSLFWHTDQHSFEVPQMIRLTVKGIELIGMQKECGATVNSYALSFEEDKYPVRFNVVSTPPTQDGIPSYTERQYQPMFWRSREEADAAASNQLNWARDNLELERDTIDHEISAINKVMVQPIKDFER